GYADDVQISSRTESVIHRMLSRTEEFLQWSRLELNDKTVRAVRKWVGLNTHSTRDIIFQSRRDGGLGVPNIEWVYTATRTAHLLNMLSSDDLKLREMARESLLLHLQRRKVPPAVENEPQFLGFKRKENGKLDINATGFGVRSDWMDLNDLCHRLGLQLEWATSDGTPVALNNRIITDPLTYIRAIYEQDGTHHNLTITSARGSILTMKRSNNAQHWSSLSL
ncbi:unnamed protein product, partial [Merluccius merluccius]